MSGTSEVSKSWELHFAPKSQRFYDSHQITGKLVWGPNHGRIRSESKSQQNIINWSLAKIDVSTGEFLAQEGQDINNLRQELIKLKAAEVISEKNSISNKNWYEGIIDITEFNQTSFSKLEAKTTIKNHYCLKNIDGLAVHSESLSIRTVGGLIAYLNKTHPNA